METHIHPFDLFEKLNALPLTQLLRQQELVIDGVKYIEDTSVPYDPAAAARNGLI